jgi:hypothetical protein
MARHGKQATKIRSIAEFDLARLQADVRAPAKNSTGGTWSLEAIVSARDLQLTGKFALPVEMAKKMRTDDAIFVARTKRLSPQECIAVAMVPALRGGSRALAIAREATALFGQDGIGLRLSTIASVHACLVDHGIAVARVRATPRADGSRVDMHAEYWPLEAVYWDAHRRSLMTQTAGGQLVEIEHANGEWIVFRRHEHEPWAQTACILSSCLVWARHAFGLRDWSKGSAAHGNAKVVGEMQEGTVLQQEDGSLTPEAQSFIELMRAIASGDSQAGIRPAGSKTEYLSNSSNAWQVWNELVQGAEKAAARIYLGNDGSLGTSSNAPGVNLEALFGVETNIIEVDLRCLEVGFAEGLIQPWCAVNFGDSSLAPTRRYMIPDTDADAAREAKSKRRQAFHEAVERARTNGFVIDQSYVDALAEEMDVESMRLVASEEKRPTVALAPTDIAGVLKANEVRAVAGLEPLTLADGSPDPDGQLPHAVFVAKALALSNAPTDTTPVEPQGVDPAASA